MSGEKKRSLNKKRYFLAFAITSIIFVLGFMLGLLIDAQRITQSKELNEQQDLDYRSMQLQYEYINQLSMDEDCDSLSIAFDRSFNKLEDSRLRLENYIKSSATNKDEYLKIKRAYISTQLQYWLFSKKKKQICDSDDVSVLYFFSDTKNCPECDEQSFVLTYLKNLFGMKLLIFSIDADFKEEPMVDLILNSNNITAYPTMLIDGRKYDGFKSKSGLLSVLCPSLSEYSVECNGYY